MSLLNSAKKGIQKYLDSKKEEREFEEKLRRDARINERQIYEKEYKEAARQAAVLRAKRAAEKNTGLAKLRAISQTHSSGRPKDGMFSKLSEYTQANLKRREEAMAKTAALRKAALEERQRMLAERQQARSNPGTGVKRSSWY